MSEIRKSFYNLSDVVGKTLTGFLETGDDGRIALLFDDDSSIEIYAHSEDDEGVIGTQSVVWSEYDADKAVDARLVTREKADAATARRRAFDEKNKQAEIDRLQRELTALRAQR